MDKRRGSFKLRKSVLLTAVALFALLPFTPFYPAIERYSYDLLFRFRGSTSAPDNIAIVAIDEESFEALQRPWPWPRRIHAQLIDALAHAGARAIAFDVVFADPSTPDEDSQLQLALSRFAPVVLASDFDVVDDPRFARETLVLPQEQFLSVQNRTGYVNYPIDSDAFLRKLTVRPEERMPFAWEAARAQDASLRPPAAGATLYINFLGSARHIPTASYYQALEPSKYLPPDFFRGKLVFVGLSTSSTASANLSTRDHYFTPFSRILGQSVAGVEVHATVAANFLAHNFIGVPDSRPVTVLAFLAGLAFVFLFAAMSPAWGLLSWAVTTAILGGGASYLFASKQIYLPYSRFCLPLLAAYLASLVNHFLNVRQERNFVKNTFSHYVSPAVVSELLRHPELLELGGTRVEGTVLFLDIAGFTTFSERLTPEELVSVLNRNMGALSDIIIACGGMVDKYIGDSIMAVWGVPLPNRSHAHDACRAALQISQTMKALSETERTLSGVELSVRVGVNSGEMVAGNIGGQHHINYTVLGNVVNFASRVEGVNRVYGTDILIGENTAALIKDSFTLRHVDTIRVKGQSTPTAIYELRSEALTPQEHALTERYHHAFSLYQARRWEEAEKVFSEILAQQHDGPAATLQTRCRELRSQTPHGEWDGVHVMETK